MLHKKKRNITDRTGGLQTGKYSCVRVPGKKVNFFYRDTAGKNSGTIMPGGGR
jgi:hypothetical protein